MVPVVAAGGALLAPSFALQQVLALAVLRQMVFAQRRAEPLQHRRCSVMALLMKGPTRRERHTRMLSSLARRTTRGARGIGR